MKTGTSRTGSGLAAGFTLLELIVVLGVVALMAALAFPTLIAGRSGADLKSAVSVVGAGLRQARTDAIFQSREVPFMVDVDERQITAGRRGTELLPPSIDLTFRTAESEVDTQSRGAIRFYSDGSSTGGWIELAARDSERKPVRISVDWLTGRVSVLD